MGNEDKHIPTSVELEDSIKEDLYNEKDPAKKKDLAETYKTVKEANVYEEIESEKLRLEQEKLDLDRARAKSEKKYQIAIALISLLGVGVTAGCKIVEKREEGTQKRLFQKEGFTMEETGTATYNPKKRWL